MYEGGSVRGRGAEGRSGGTERREEAERVSDRVSDQALPACVKQRIARSRCGVLVGSFVEGIGLCWECGGTVIRGKSLHRRIRGCIGSAEDTVNRPYPPRAPFVLGAVGQEVAEREVARLRVLRSAAGHVGRPAARLRVEQKCVGEESRVSERTCFRDQATAEGDGGTRLGDQVTAVCVCVCVCVCVHALGGLSHGGGEYCNRT